MLARAVFCAGNNKHFRCHAFWSNINKWVTGRWPRVVVESNWLESFSPYPYRAGILTEGGLAVVARGAGHVRTPLRVHPSEVVDGVAGPDKGGWVGRRQPHNSSWQFRVRTDRGAAGGKAERGHRTGTPHSGTRGTGAELGGAARESKNQTAIGGCVVPNGMSLGCHNLLGHIRRAFLAIGVPHAPWRAERTVAEDG